MRSKYKKYGRKSETSYFRLLTSLYTPSIINKQQQYTVSLAGFAITFLSAVLFSTKAVIVKVAFADTHIDALTLLTLRMGFALPFYAVIAWLESRRKEAAPVTGRQWVYIIFLGLFGYYLSSLFDFMGLQYVTAGLERLILFLYPTFVVLINRLVFKQPVTRKQSIALLLTYSGIAIAYIGEMQVDTSNPGFLWGSFLIFLCSITFAVYIVGSGRVIPQVGANRFTAFAMLSSSAGVFLHFALAGNAAALGGLAVMGGMAFCWRL